MADNQNNNQGNGILDVAEGVSAVPDVINIRSTSEPQAIIDNDLADNVGEGVLSAIGDLLSGL